MLNVIMLSVIMPIVVAPDDCRMQEKVIFLRNPKSF
jgi:hypothetical protein